MRARESEGELTSSIKSIKSFGLKLFLGSSSERDVPSVNQISFGYIIGWYFQPWAKRWPAETSSTFSDARWSNRVAILTNSQQLILFATVFCRSVFAELWMFSCAASSKTGTLFDVVVHLVFCRFHNFFFLSCSFAPLSFSLSPSARHCEALVYFVIE